MDNVQMGSALCLVPPTVMQQCSNANLFIILPAVALSGILLVVLLIFLNLTVVECDGTINAFILYNIVSINNIVLFPSHNANTATGVAYMFILENVDMGIEICFYNGMDDYAKMWLQLLFSLYLVLIATALIVGSRYSSIQEYRG